MGLSCSVAGCTSRHDGYGFCKRHLRRHKLGLPLDDELYRLDTAIKRFMKFVEIQPDGCWKWLGSFVADTEYGQFWYEGTNQRANRVSMKLFGEDPGDLCSLHKCDRPWCVNPDHLFAGTPKENSEDMVSKGRENRGEARPQSKLTEDAVREIRASTDTGLSLAKKYGVDDAVIGRIRRGTAWKHVA